MEDKLKEYIWQDFRRSNIPKYYKYFYLIDACKELL